MGAKQARNNLSQLLGTVHYGNETLIVVKLGKPFAVAISPQQYDRYKELFRERAVQATERVQQRDEHPDPHQVERDITAVVEEVRQERYDQHTG